MAANTANVNVYNYSGNTVTTSAYSVLIASLPNSVKAFQIVDTSGSLLKLAYGPTGSEIDFCCTGVGTAPTKIPIYLAAGVQISIKAINTNASSGYNILSLIS